MTPLGIAPAQDADDVVRWLRDLDTQRKASGGAPHRQ
ncbi:hypothetical protein HDC93_007167 [Streptomyces sp. AK010]|nr:hypothetical protein [Streptomyces sp. AK010]